MILLTLKMLLAESRSHPELNPKISINQILINQSKATKDRVAGAKNLFVSFTDIEKLGVNPMPRNPRTPYGIYAYPVQYVLSITGETKPMSTLPWFGDKPFATTLKAVGNIINLTEMTASTMTGLYSQIKKLWNDHPGKDKKSIIKAIDGFIKDAATKAEFAAYPGGKFWYVTQRIAFEIVGPSLGTEPQMAWTRLFRQLGIDGLIDGPEDGLGIIQSTEPTQAVFFSIANVSVIGRYNNAHSPDSMADGIAQGKQVRTDRNEIAELLATTSDPKERADGIIKVGDPTTLRLINSLSERLDVLAYAPQLIRGLQRPSIDEQTTALVASRGTAARFIKSPHEQAFINYIKQSEFPIRAVNVLTFFPTPSVELQLALCKKDPKMFDNIKTPSRETIEYMVDWYSKQGTAVRDFPTKLLDRMDDSQSVSK